MSAISGRSCCDSRQTTYSWMPEDVLKFLFSRLDMFLDNHDSLEMLLTRMPARSTEASLILVPHCGRKFWYQDLCFLVGVSVLCLFPRNGYSSYAWSWMAGRARPFSFTWGAHWCSDGFTARTGILRMRSLRPVPWSNTTLPVISDYLLETKVVWLLFYFFKVYLIKNCQGCFFLSQSYICW